MKEKLPISKRTVSSGTVDEVVELEVVLDDEVDEVVVEVVVEVVGRGGGTVGVRPNALPRNDAI